MKEVESLSKCWFGLLFYYNFLWLDEESRITFEMLILYYIVTLWKELDHSWNVDLVFY